jgi:hypothetical protein
MNFFFSKALVGTPIKFLITQNGLKKEEDMGVEVERDQELFFRRIEANYHSSSSNVFFSSFTTDTQRIFVILQFAHPMTQKSFNLVKE